MNGERWDDKAQSVKNYKTQGKKSTKVEITYDDNNDKKKDASEYNKKKE